MDSLYFCGIGGIGMSGLARFLAARGEKISGSDAMPSPLLEELTAEGMHIFAEQKKEHISKDCTEFIYSEAIREDHPERLEAQARNIPQKSYFQKLGEISQDFFTICIAGTHGKSGTTVMAGLALEKLGVRPNVIVGTKVFEWDWKNFRSDSSNILLIESCEYRESFLFLEPDIIVLTTVEPDHLDYYHTAENYFRGFEKFVQKLPKQGMLIADFQDERIQKIGTYFSGKKIDAQKFVAHVPELAVKGEHYRQNAAKVLALCSALELDPEPAMQSLRAYRGAWRRFEFKGEKNGVLVLDDYGHHPTEIWVTLETLTQTYPERKRWIIFQPHQYSRTAEFLAEFGKSFSAADEILIPNIYRVRDAEEDVKKVSPEILVQEIAKNLTADQRVRYTENFAKTLELLQRETKEGDVILTIGAGPVHEVGEQFLSA